MHKLEHNKSKLYLYWQTEAVRLFELNHNTLNDAEVLQDPNNKFDNINDLIIFRADKLAQRKKINVELGKWLSGAKAAITVLWVLALLSGIGVAMGALANHKVNLAAALIALLGLNTVTLLIWLTSLLPISKPKSLLADIWLKINKVISKKTSQPVAGKAFMSLFVRHRLWPATIGIISNSTWLVALCAAILTLLVKLSTQSFSFHWETTLLTPEIFIRATNIIGALPEILGFPIPSNEAVHASVSGFASLENMQSQWSVWLIGCIITWGILPRLAALLFCLLQLVRGIHKMSLDSNLDGLRQLKSRFSPSQVNMGIDKPDKNTGINIRQKAINQYDYSNLAILGYELDETTKWPPINTAENILDLGIISNRTGRDSARKTIVARPRLNILFVCNGRLTPDRGTINFMAQISESCAVFTVFCTPGKHKRTWQSLLEQNNFDFANSPESWQLRFTEQP